MEDVDLSDNSSPAGSPIIEAIPSSGTDASEPVDHSQQELEEGHSPLAQGGTPRGLEPKTSRDTPLLPKDSHRIEVPPDTEADADTDAAAEVDLQSGSDEDGPATDLTPEIAHAPALRTGSGHHDENGTVGGKISPPNPYSEEGTRAAEERLAEEVEALEAELDGGREETEDEEATPSSQAASQPPSARGDAHTDPATAMALAEAEQQMRAANAHLHRVQNSLDDFGLNSHRVGNGELAEPLELRGMLYHDGIDSLGRPVIVINADAVASTVSRQWACQYMVQCLEPIVSQGPYVIVMVNSGSKSKRLPAGWLISTYRSLSRPFRKNVKYIVLVRPSGMLKAMLTLVRPFVSGKAHRKVCKVESLAGIATATNHEVTIQHLGPRFAAAAGRFIADGLARSNNTNRVPTRSASGVPQQNTFAMPDMASGFGNVNLTERG